MSSEDRSIWPTGRGGPRRDSGPMSATTTTVKTYPAYFIARANGEFEPTASAAGWWQIDDDLPAYPAAGPV